jgi:hypothetical protein
VPEAIFDPPCRNIDRIVETMSYSQCPGTQNLRGMNARLKSAACRCWPRESSQRNATILIAISV